MTATTTHPPLPRQRRSQETPAAAATPAARSHGRLIGALFLAGFLTYGAGFALVDSVVGGPDFVADVASKQTTLVLGAVLMLLNTIVDIGKAVLFFPLVERHSRKTAVTYLAAMIFEVAMLAVGALLLLSLVPLSDQRASGGISGDLAQTFGSLAVDTSTLAYQVGQAGLAFGAFFLCLVLYRTRMVPRFLAAWGAVGYVLHFTGAMAELFGSHISLYLLVPGGLFELALGSWLLVKGVRPGTPASS